MPRPPPSKPAFVGLCDPTLVDRPPTGAGWAHEIKWDGWRLQAVADAGVPALYTRQGNDVAKQFRPIAAAMTRLAAKRAILDGEAVALDDSGRPDFHAVRSAGARVVYKAFDLLWLGREDLRPLPWRERKTRLEELLERVDDPALSYVEAVETDGTRMLAEVCKLGLEGVVSKRVDSPYLAGKSTAWVKCRCAVVETVAVIGFTGRYKVSALHVARAQDGELVPAGRIEHGISAEAAAQLSAALRPRVTDRSPLLGRATRAIAVKPGVLVDISHRGVTEGGVMRHPRFERIRPDLEDGVRARPKRRR